MLRDTQNNLKFIILVQIQWVDSGRCSIKILIFWKVQEIDWIANIIIYHASEGEVDALF